MGPHRMPAAEVDIPADLVRALLHDQHPDLAVLPLEVLSNGWDNVIYRLGDALAVRLPRRRARRGAGREGTTVAPRAGTPTPLARPGAGADR